MHTLKTYTPIFHYFRALKLADKLSAAYLFVGNNPDNDFAVTRGIAQLKYCTSEQYPCAGCEGCAGYMAGRNYDVLVIIEDPIKIEHIRQIQEFLRLRSMSGLGKAVLLKNIDVITEEAANAFLKTLEEPPRLCLIAATTSRKDMLLPTINSRFKKIYLPFNDEGVQVPVDASLAATLFTHGMTAIKEKDRQTITSLVYWLVVFYRDALIYQMTGNKEHLIDAHNYEIILRYTRDTRQDAMVANCEKLMALHADLENINVNLAKNIIDTIICPKLS